jgi:Tol biopolymer transport system component
VWVGRDGKEEPIDAPARAYQSPRLSPDGRRVALSIDAPEPQVWIFDLSRETLARLTLEGTYNRSPEWSPDGTRVALVSNKDGAWNCYWQPADGGTGLERLNTGPAITSPASFSPDGKLLALSIIDPVTQRDVGILDITTGQIEPFLKNGINETAPRFSPDGRWLAYVSDESGQREVYVQPYPGPGGKWQISTGGGVEPVWNANGRELIYRSGDRVLAVEYSANGGFSASRPRLLFSGTYTSATGTDSSPEYDLSPDGRRFLMLKEAEKTASGVAPQIIVVQNWAEELARRVVPGR